MGQCRRTVNSTGRSIDQYSLHIRAGFIPSPDSTLQITRCTQQASLQNPSTHPSTRFPILFNRPTVQSNPCLSHPVECHCCRIALHCVMPCVPLSNQAGHTVRDTTTAALLCLLSWLAAACHRNIGISLLEGNYFAFCGRATPVSVVTLSCLLAYLSVSP